MVEKITIYGNPVLRTRAEKIKNVGDSVKKMMRTLSETMAENGGIGLAAPQIGISLRAAVINTTGEAEDLICVINPVIETSSGKTVIKEGCLSIPGIFENVKRPEFIRVRALDMEGRERIIEALFTDKISFCRKIFIYKALLALKAGHK